MTISCYYIYNTTHTPKTQETLKKGWKDSDNQRKGTSTTIQCLLDMTGTPFFFFFLSFTLPPPPPQSLLCAWESSKSRHGEGRCSLHCVLCCPSIWVKAPVCTDNQYYWLNEWLYLLTLLSSVLTQNIFVTLSLLTVLIQYLAITVDSWLSTTIG